MRELDVVALTKDLPEENLVAGDVGTIVDVHDDGAGFDVEFMTLDGDTIVIATLPRDAIRKTRPTEVPHARALA